MCYYGLEKTDHDNELHWFFSMDNGRVTVVRTPV